MMEEKAATHWKDEGGRGERRGGEGRGGREGGRREVGRREGGMRGCKGEEDCKMATKNKEQLAVIIYS